MDFLIHPFKLIGITFLAIIIFFTLAFIIANVIELFNSDPSTVIVSMLMGLVISLPITIVGYLGALYVSFTYTEI